MIFFVIVNQTFEILLSFLNASDFCILTLLPEIFYAIDSNGLPVAYLGFSMQAINLSAGKSNVVSCFPMFVSNMTQQKLPFKIV